MVTAIRQRRLPALARPLAEVRRKGHRPASQAIIVRLDVWPPNYHFGLSEPESREACKVIDGRSPNVWWPQVVVPLDTQPNELDFSFAADLGVTVAVWPSMSPPVRVRALLVEIIAANPLGVWVVDIERSRWWTVKSPDRGIEVQL